MEAGTKAKMLRFIGNMETVILPHGAFEPTFRT